MSRKIQFSEERYHRRHRRHTRKTILEKHMRTLSYRAAEIEFEEWTKTEEYRQEVEDLREIARRIKEKYDEDIEFVE